MMNLSWFWQKVTSNGALLMGSAVVSKFLGLLRDRLISSHFEAEWSDLIFLAFRIPDFFFYLFVGATLSVVFIPRLEGLSKKSDQEDFFSSFLYRVSLGLLLICVLGIFGAEYFLGKLGGSALESSEKMMMTVDLVRWLFGGIFFLGISGVFAAFLQAKEKYLTMALGPVIYMASICGGIYWGAEEYGIVGVGVGALCGAAVHAFLNIAAWWRLSGKLHWTWEKPSKAWEGFGGDFGRRVITNSGFQINQTVDVFIAQALIVGATTGFAIGTVLGSVLNSIVGFPIANVAFPKLTKARADIKKQKEILKYYLKIIFGFSIPVSIFLVLWGGWTLGFLFDLKEEVLPLAEIVLFWTALSMPFGVAIPLLSRFFLSREDSTTPLYITFGGLGAATLLALCISFVWFGADHPQAILGLAIGNATANVLVFVGLGWKVWKINK